jgi:hypothetical protein
MKNEKSLRIISDESPSIWGKSEQDRLPNI